MVDWKDSARKRREVRQAKPLDAPIPFRSVKDTKKWCKGKVGREHKPTCFVDNKSYYTVVKKQPRILACSACGVTLGYWEPWPLMKKWKTPKPAWVDK